MDNEQKYAALTDEDSYLIVAGAGSGKTLTMIGKMKYLIECKEIDPKDILCISFTNFTTASLKKAINKSLNYDIDIFTFHKLSLEIIKNKGIKVNICKDNLLSSIIDDFMRRDLICDSNLLYKFIKNYCLMGKIKINNNNLLKLEEEIIIENYLYFNNINYEYKMVGAYKDKIISAFYLKDYNLYIKYYDITIDNNPLTVSNFLGELEIIRRYLKGNVLELYPYNFKDGTIIDEINNFFKKNMVKLNEKDSKLIYDVFMSDGKNIKNLCNLIFSFINMFKSNNYPYILFENIENKIKKVTNKIERNKLLVILNIIRRVYDKYQLYLNLNNQIDFNDMIIVATNLIKENEVILKYKYIIVDEYQDTSKCRYDLINAIKISSDSKLVAVGDDFQSIYRFTGCDVNMFLEFKKYFNYSKIIYLTNTYRNSQELINVAGTFIMKNKYQIKKVLLSSKSLYKPIKIYFYKSKLEISNLFDKITDNEIFVLGRNNSDINYFNNNKFLINDKKIVYLKNKDLDITFMSVHKSKGLESKAVVVVNLEDKMLGFPSKCEEDILIHYLNDNKMLYPYDEERRLFYVALTRTKGNVFLFVPRKNPSIFISEIIKDSKNLIEFIN